MSSKEDLDGQPNDLNAKVTIEEQEKQMNTSKDNGNNKTNSQVGSNFKSLCKSDKKKLFEDGKTPGWGGLTQLYTFSNKSKQDMKIVNKEMPNNGVAAEIKVKAVAEDKKIVEKCSGFKVPQHKPKIHFEPSEALQKEANKVNEYLEKFIVKMADDEEKQPAKATEDKALPSGQVEEPPVETNKAQAVEDEKTNEGEEAPNTQKLSR